MIYLVKQLLNKTGCIVCKCVSIGPNIFAEATNLTCIGGIFIEGESFFYGNAMVSENLRCLKFRYE